jgi:hypothetical protein
VNQAARARFGRRRFIADHAPSRGDWSRVRSTTNCLLLSIFRFEDVGSAKLTVKRLVYGYSAFTPDGYPSGRRITGTDLVAPAF